MAIVGVVVVLAAVGITGFVAPGFFLSDDESAAGGADVSTPRGAAEAMVNAINTKNAQAVRSLACPGADESIEQVATGLDRITSAKLLEVGDGPNEAAVRLEVGLQMASAAVTTNGHLVSADSQWCWSTFDGEGTRSGGPPAGGDASSAPDETSSGVDVGGAEPMVQEFLSAINDGDVDAATAKFCRQDGSLTGAVQLIVEKGGNLTLGALNDTVGSDSYLRWDVTGSQEGKVTASTEDSGANWCVQSFAAY